MLRGNAYLVRRTVLLWCYRTLRQRSWIFSLHQLRRPIFILAPAFVMIETSALTPEWPHKYDWLRAWARIQSRPINGYHMVNP